MLSPISHQIAPPATKASQQKRETTTPVQFGWYAKDKADLLSTSHFVVDETNLNEFFPGISKKSDLPRLPRSLPQAPTELIEKMAKQLANTDGSRFIALDVSDELGISPNIIQIYFQHLQTAIHEELKDVYFNGRSVEAPMAYPQNGIKAATEISNEGLHWDGDNFLSPLFLSLILGKRTNIQPDSALSFLGDFHQWAKDTFSKNDLENKIPANSFDDLTSLLKTKFHKEAQGYTIALPPNDGYTRLLLVLNDPQKGGVAHGVSKPEPIDPDRQMHREFKRALSRYN